MSVSAISSMAAIGAIGYIAPVAPARAVDRVVGKRKSATDKDEDVDSGFKAAAGSPAASSSSAVLTALIGLQLGG